MTALFDVVVVALGRVVVVALGRVVAGPAGPRPSIGIRRTVPFEILV